MSSENPHIPYDPGRMEWFLADLIQQFTFSNGDNPLVWVNTVLIRADSLDVAYEKALKLGKQYDETYTNSDGIEVTVKFEGLRDLLLIYEPLEDGAELSYSEFSNLTSDQIAAMVKPKEELGAFVTHDVKRRKAMAKQEGME